MNYNILRYEYGSIFQSEEYDDPESDVNDPLTDFYRIVFLKYYDEDDRNQDQLREVFEWFNYRLPDELTRIGLYFSNNKFRTYSTHTLVMNHNGISIMKKHVELSRRTSYIMWKF